MQAAKKTGGAERPLVYKHGRRPSKPARGWEHFDLPCGWCIGCRIDRSRDWALRCFHEAHEHEANSWITLTYDDDHLPYGGTLVPKHLQTFLKRLRRRIFPTRIRFYGCGEYGDQLDRPHYHVCIFGYDFPDKYLWRQGDEGTTYYRSDLLEGAWKLGLSEVTDLTLQNAGYTARYCMKKINGKKAEEHYERIVESTGEAIQLHPEFARMSNRPGIGAEWFKTYQGDCYPKDFVTVNGKKYPIPAYYDKLFERQDSEALALLKQQRVDQAATRQHDSTPARLESRETCFRARISKLERPLES